MDVYAIWWWAWCRNRKWIKGPLQTFFDSFHNVRHFQQELCHWSQLSSWSREWKRLLISIIKAFILINWAFIIQIIIATETCPAVSIRCQIYLLYPISYPILYCLSIYCHEPSNIEGWYSILEENLRYWARYSKLASLCHLILGLISKGFILYRRKRPSISRLYPSLLPDIEVFYSISVAISNSSRAISSIYWCQAPLSISFVQYQMFHQSISSIYQCSVQYVMQTSGMMSCLPAERAGQAPELEVEAGGQPVDSSSSHKVMTRWKHLRNN